ncbi:MAG: hypothetical protein KAR21_18635 [Spirochaetales bacterium]|nr:hypothetical protein [Spirochaetales bacterium]
MKNYLDLAQNYLDTDRTVPHEIYLRLNERERQLITKMVEIKNKLKTEMDQSLPDRNMRLLKQSDSSKRRFRIDPKMLFAAAALLTVVIYFPISESIETKILLKEETVRFVDQLFQEDDETYILVDSGITNDWFNSSIIPDFQ